MKLTAEGHRAMPYKDSPNLFHVYIEGVQWGAQMGCQKVAELNALVDSGGIRELIRLNEALHEKRFAQIADAVLLRLKAPTALREQVNFLITHHMEELKSDKNALRRKLSKYGGENLRLLIQLQLADQKGKGTPIHGFDKTCEKMLRLVEELEQEEGRLQIRDLNIDGHDLMALGFEAGPALGECQKKLLEMVLNGEVPNEKAALTEKAKEILEH
jgi:tRNA nucleotidyltransferase (CCA-adding enzyme)